MGYGLRYEYGSFRQSIENGFRSNNPTTGWLSPIPEDGPPREDGGVPLGCSSSWTAR
jgi:hypothetical protein